VPNYDTGSILSKERAGRYLYKYRSPKIFQNQSGLLDLTDHINVIDKDTGLGVQVQITLTTIQITRHVTNKSDTLESIAQKYGTTVVDILEVSSKNEKELLALIARGENEEIDVPQSYSRSVMDKSDEEKRTEYEVIYIVNYLIDYFGKSVNTMPESLLNILDFNNDGVINIQEFHWIDNNKRSSYIRQKYEELKTWHESNEG
jgi:hypothetical protein